MEEFRIDPDAKGKIELTKQFDSNDQPYYIGKLQLPMTLDFDDGVSFMVFTAEDGVEELQIAPLDPSRRKGSKNDAVLSGGRFSVELHSMKDHNGNTYYIGEATGPVVMKLRNGIFFSVFTSRPGEEELQISKLTHRRPNKNKFERIQPQVERIERRRTPAGWPPRIEDSIS
jgi:hypothetical protein